MVRMPEDLILLLNRWRTVPVATAGSNGIPDIAPKTVRVQDPDTIVWTELYFMQTWKNLRERPVASLCVWENFPPFTAYRINGTTALHEHDEVTAKLDRRVWAGHEPAFAERTKKMAAVVLTVTEIFDLTPRTGSAGTRIV